MHRRLECGEVGMGPRGGLGGSRTVASRGAASGQSGSHTSPRAPESNVMFQCGAAVQPAAGRHGPSGSHAAWRGVAQMVLNYFHSLLTSALPRYQVNACGSRRMPSVYSGDSGGLNDDEAIHSSSGARPAAMASPCLLAPPGAPR